MKNLLEEDRYLNLLRKISVLYFILFAITSPLSANRLMFETSTGTLTDFNLSESSTGTNPIVSTYNIPNYGGSSEYWSYDGFVGRLIYQGEPNTITIENVGPVASSTPTPTRFYYTKVVYPNRSSDPSKWREVFFVARVKGKKHDNGSVDIYSNNFVLDNPGDTFTVSGAGEELSTPGNIAYTASGNSGTYNVTTGYIYKYPYKYLWIDFTALRTANATKSFSRRAKGYFESIIQLKGEGIHQVISLQGYNSPNYYDENPHAYSFSIERLAPDSIPFSQLITHTTYQDSYLVGHVRFHSTDVTGTVGFYADSSGTSTDFLFSATVGGAQIAFPYNVVFDPVFCGNSNVPSTISSSNNAFTSEYTTVNSVIDSQSSTENALTGDIRIFVANGLTNTSFRAANYTSTIYAIVQTN